MPPEDEAAAIRILLDDTLVPCEPAEFRPQGGRAALFLLMARYNGLPLIPVDIVRRDYFQHLTPEKFLRKVLAAEISLPIVRMELSQKCAKGVSINDLAAYLDKRIEAAHKECEQLKRCA